MLKILPSQYKRNAVLTLVIFFSLTMIGNGQKATWKIDSGHSKIQFIAKNLGIFEISGIFKKFEGSVVTNNDSFVNSKIWFTADARSINTDNEKRDNHLRTDDFFNAYKYPLIKFESRSFENAGKDKYKLTGYLTIRDITKLTELEVIYLGTIIDGFNRTMAGFTISGKINRHDYGIDFNNTNNGGEAIVGDMIRLEINVQLEKQ